MYQNINNNNLKTFSLIWSFIFFLITIYPILFGSDIRIWSLFPAIIFLIIAYYKPLMLKYFYIVWVKLGNIIGSIISKITMLILYFFLFTPVSIILKLLGRDLLNKKINLNKKSYWLSRKTPVNTMKKQF